MKTADSEKAVGGFLMLETVSQTTKIQFYFSEKYGKIGA
jgi:hypothetical protein